MKLGIVGTGTIAREVLPLLRGWGIEPRALCGTPRSKDAVEELCRANDIKEGCCIYGKMLSAPDVDTVYVAVPNHLHCDFARQALRAGKHVIVEKPMTSNDREAAELVRLAKERSLYLFEAISTAYLPNYQKIRELLPRIGKVKIVACNFSQYSRRYDEFRKGNILPVFDPEKAGGALMDLNLYNLHYIMGLFGSPKSVRYQANIERGIDTSGVVTMDYGSFQAIAIAAKDCSAPASYVIQGTEGYIQQSTPANFCGAVTLRLNDGTEEVYDEQPMSRMEPEFRHFLREIDSGDRSNCYEMLSQSVAVSKAQTEARMGAKIYFPSDGEGMV